MPLPSRTRGSDSAAGSTAGLLVLRQIVLCKETRAHSVATADRCSNGNVRGGTRVFRRPGLMCEVVWYTHSPLGGGRTASPSAGSSIIQSATLLDASSRSTVTPRLVASAEGSCASRDESRGAPARVLRNVPARSAACCAFCSTLRTHTHPVLWRYAKGWVLWQCACSSGGRGAWQQTGNLKQRDAVFREQPTSNTRM